MTKITSEHDTLIICSLLPVIYLDIHLHVMARSNNDQSLHVVSYMKLIRFHVGNIHEYIKLLLRIVFQQFYWENNGRFDKL